ncbi:MAG: leucine-rich repeat domain-containing protein [Sporocytophaga sp.]|uniref:leucine-rich repeat domain-containing protein n=1 Tax=Sporocytophaga sp. TaxID=2231183 RepID=UPI001B1D7F65|nr:leucine-rich repeat domain-containing protein [Sporocytophaga sp.]MBO9701858.1 leucine-rich repeat domain-containing protein [Sporocytophaga sp.]
MSNRISKIPNDVQDRNSEAWKKLCEYVEYVAKNGLDEFAPREYLSADLFSQILTLPETIKKLKNVKKVWLYGSRLKRIPPEIGQMESLEYFDLYTSYDLHWFPYEITKCKKLKDSRISTRALYGNFKNRMGFPKLDHNPVRYQGDTLSCSVCEKEISYEETNQFWITLRIATDVVPLLANVCSEDCKSKLPTSPKGYVEYPHKGGAGLKQPSYEEWEAANVVKFTLEDLGKSVEKTKDEKPTFLKLIKKIWEK